MNTMYGIFMREVITELGIRYEDCEYSRRAKLQADIYFDSEIILEACVKDSVTDAADAGELAYSYLKETETTTEMLLEAIRDPEKILYYGYCAVFDEAVDSFVENFDYIEDED